MTHLIRILIGVGIVVGAFLVKRKASPVNGDGTSRDAVSLSLWGNELSPSALNLIVVGFSIVGVLIILFGIIGMVRRKT